MFDCLMGLVVQTFLLYKLHGNSAVYDFTSVVPSKPEQRAIDRAQLMQSSDAVYISALNLYSSATAGLNAIQVPVYEITSSR
jgi:hypothetical protein